LIHFLGKEKDMNKKEKKGAIGKWWDETPPLTKALQIGGGTVAAGVTAAVGVAVATGGSVALVVTTAGGTAAVAVGKAAEILAKGAAKRR